MPSCVLTFTHYLLSLKVIFDLGIMFYAVFTIFYFTLFSQSKYFTWGILQSRKPKRRKHLGITFSLEVWRDKTDFVYFIFFYFDPFPSCVFNQSGNPVYFGDKQCFQISKPYRLRLISFFFQSKNQQNKMILLNNNRLFLYFFSISMLFDLSPFHRIILN